MNTKELLENVYALCDASERSGAALAFGITDGMRDVLRADLVQFLLYLTVTDGITTTGELEYINDLLGYGFTDEHLEKAFEAGATGMYAGLLNAVPTSFRVLLLDGSLSGNMDEARELYMALFACAAQDVCETDGIIVSGELEHTKSFLELLKGFAA